MNIINELLAGTPRAELIARSWSQTPRVLTGGAAKLRRFVDLGSIPEMVSRSIDDPTPASMSIGDHARADYGKLAAMQQICRQQLPTLEQINEVCGASTLVINAIHRYNAGALQLMHELFDGFAERLTLNLYYSPKGGDPGLGLHYDRWEIFAAHLLGSKRWRIWAPTIDYPIDSRYENAQDILATPALLDQVVRAGEVLYLPRGAWHLANPTDEPSLHLTIGVHVKKGIDVGHWLFAEATKRAELRRNLPMSINGDDPQQGQRAAEAAIDSLRAVINAKTATQNFLRYQFLREYSDTFGAVEQDVPTAAARHQRTK